MEANVSERASERKYRWEMVNTNANGLKGTIQKREKRKPLPTCLMN